nr:hypothetical protein [Caulobacter vibrioides]
MGRGARGRLKFACHPGSLAEAIRDPGAARTALRRPLGPGSTLRFGRDDTRLEYGLGS